MRHEKQKQKSQDNLQSLMNIGPAIAKRLHAIGIKSAAQIMESDPEAIYEQLEQKEGGKLDICVLYQLRGAIQNTPWWKCKNRE
jgi:hypothetical protein